MTRRTLGLEVIKTPVQSPKANSLCERLIGTLRRECLDWMTPLPEELTYQIGLPSTQKPHPVEAHFGQMIELAIRNVVQVAPRPRVRDSSVSQTRVLIWYSEG